MIQIWFLSIVLNILSGLYLSADYLRDKFPAVDNLHTNLSNSGARLILGVFTLLFGFLKILSVIEGDVPVLGDILPALSGILMGLAILIEYYRERATVATGQIERMEGFFTRNRNFLGISGVGVAVLHFFLPRIIFL